MGITDILNEMQKSAVTKTEGACLVLAGAGSGKTRTIACRIAYLIADKGIPPWNILAVTFTNKAAEEMRERVLAMTVPGGAMPIISTFHSLGLRILRQETAKIDRMPSFTVYDDSDQKKAFGVVLDIHNLSRDNFPLAQVMSKISSLKDKLITCDDFEKEAVGFYENAIAKIYKGYENILKNNNAVDFDDLIFKSVLLLKNNQEIRLQWAKRFRYIMVDEYQDTNHSQYVLMRLLSENWHNLCVVGDEDQSIYRWRGAEIRNILEFQDDFPDAVVIKLEENYRSTPEILNAAGAVIGNNEGRIGKTLWTRKDSGRKVMLIQAATDIEEADRIAERIRRLRSGFHFTDIAVLYRTNAQSRLLEESFMRNRLPYTIVGGTKFYDRKEVKDVIAYLKVIANTDDDVSLLRIINTPARGIGAKSLDMLDKVSSSQHLSCWKALREISEDSARSLKPLQDFYFLMNGFINQSDLRTIPNLIKFIIEGTGYFEHLKKMGEEEYNNRRENLESLVSGAAEFCDRNPGSSLCDFLDRVSLVSHVDELQHGKGVSMMTLHCAKGLEFPVVFMAGMEENIFPHSRSLDSEEELEEERRLCYVGMTRAKEVLYMSFAVRRRLYGQEEWNEPSRFISEIPSEYLAEDSLKPEIDDLLEEMQEVPSSSDKQETVMKGYLVEHTKYGIGTVQKVEPSGDGEKVSIMFQRHGHKKLHTGYAKLKIISRV